jgi:membrane protease YdiL (CAAX protease family)
MPDNEELETAAADQPVATPTRRLIGALIVTALATTLVAFFMRSANLAWFAIPLIWLTAALAAVRIQKIPPAGLGLIAPRILADLRDFLFCAVGILLFAYGAAYLAAEHILKPPLFYLPDRWPEWIIYQIVYVAVPEELFFRGYLQGVLRDSIQSLAPARPRFWNPLAITAAAIVFAAAHVAVFRSPVYALVFFPALLFGWLRARTGGIAAPILCHAFANISYAAVAATFS